MPPKKKSREDKAKERAQLIVANTSSSSSITSTSSASVIDDFPAPEEKHESSTRESSSLDSGEYDTSHADKTIEVVPVESIATELVTPEGETKVEKKQITFVREPVEQEYEDRSGDRKLDYQRMKEAMSHRTLVEIYDDDFFWFTTMAHTLFPLETQFKMGIVCAFVTGLVISVLILTAFVIVLMVDPITDTMLNLYRTFFEITSTIMGR